MNLVSAQKFPKTKPPILTIKEVEALISCARSHYLFPALLLELATGIRKGELLGLKWGCVDLDQGFITIQQTITSAWGNKIIFGEPKTEGSKRTIAIPKIVIDALKAYKEQIDKFKKAVPDWQETDYVFVTKKGNYLAPRNFDRIWAKWRDDSRIPHITFHGLRHNAISLLLYKGHDHVSVAGLSGHTQVSTLFDTYAHIVDPAGKKIAKTMDDYLKEVL